MVDDTPKPDEGLIIWEARQLVKEGKKLPKVTITKKVKVPEAQPRFIQYHVNYEGKQGTHIVVFPISMFKDDKSATEHMALTELYRRSRSK